jgi:hypothetical protein
MRITSTVLLALAVLFSGACSNRAEREPVVIHVYRDPAASVIQSALLVVGTRQLRSSHGQAVMIATIEPKSYAEGLEALGHQYHPELIIFNSLNDGEIANVVVPPQSSVHVGARQFYLVIPAWVPKEQRQTAELVLAETRKELQRASQPTAGSTP